METSLVYDRYMKNSGNRHIRIQPDYSFESSCAGIKKNHIDLWTVIISEFSGVLSWLTGVLSIDERQKAERFHFSKDRDQYVIAHGMRRVILGSYLKQHPSEIDFQYGNNGKPQLDHSERVEFNESHSGDLAVYAVTRNIPIGIDVELIRPLSQAKEIQARYFSPRESETLVGLSQEQQLHRFFEIWCGKEALLKATGAGIAGDLTRVEVPILRNGSCLQGISAARNSVRQWQLRSWCPIEGYVAVLAAEMRTPVLRQYKPTASHFLKFQ